MTLTFGFMSARDVLEKARRDFRRLSDAANRNAESEIADALFDFAVTVFHVKDWVKAHPNAPFRPHDVEALIASSTTLSAFHDLCTASKHKDITRYTPSTSQVLASAVAQTASTLGQDVPLVQRKTFVTKIVRADSSRHEAVASAAQALAEWDAFFRQHGI